MQILDFTQKYGMINAYEYHLYTLVGSSAASSPDDPVARPDETLNERQGDAYLARDMYSLVFLSELLRIAVV